MIVQSIKWRLQLWHGFLLTVLVSGLMLGFYEFERRSELEIVDTELKDVLTPLLPRFAPPRGPARPNRNPVNPDRRPAPRDIEPPLTAPPWQEFPADPPPNVEVLQHDKVYVVAWNRAGARIASTTNAPPDLRRPAGRLPIGVTITRIRGDHRELIQCFPSGRCLVVGTSLVDVWSRLHRLAVSLTVVGLSIIAVGLTIGWWMASRSLRPIADIGLAAQEIAGGDLSKRINASETESELGHLIAVLNSTFDRLETAFAQQQQFTSDAAHELRTPVSVILTQTQGALAKERSPAEYRETLEACQRSANRMKRLIESLLQLAHFDTGQEPLQRMPCDLAATTREAVEMVQPLADEHRVTISTRLMPAECLGDPERLGQVMTNLLTNAVTYNKPDGEVEVTSELKEGRVVLKVRDTGEGIAPDDVSKVFTRFYRADKSRSGTTGHSGLGLAICKSIVAAHGGTLVFTSQLGHGTTFTLSLPAVVPK